MRQRRPLEILKADSSSKLRTLLLDQFDPSVVPQLIEFGKFISTLDVDVIIFMARKSLCLYDLLLVLGIPPSERVIISDRALDLNIEMLRGKRIALIDDTLIVGTTLAKTKDFLSTEVGATVTVHVFCVDTKWQQDAIIKPDTVFLRADDRTVMNFCASLVRAMSLLPRPYLVDFPLTQPFRIRAGDLQCFLSATSWRSYRLSSPLQMTNGVEVYTFLPQSETLGLFHHSLDSDMRQYIEIAKVRAFGRYYEDILWFRLVPIVTLSPLRDSVIADLVARLLSRLRHLGYNSTHLESSIEGPLAKQRFLQFVLSASLGKAFFTDIHASIGSKTDMFFDVDDIDQHYGPWLRDSVLQCIDCAEALLKPNDNKAVTLTNKVAVIPQRVRTLAKEVLKSAKCAIPVSGGDSFQRNLVADCATLFVQMYKVRELPAREEAARLGPAVIYANSEDAPFRDRLNVGLPWISVLKHLGDTSGVKYSALHSDMTSLALDVCNDLGIAVPITCATDGVILRAYRYGEDAPFGDSELRLAYEAVKGFFRSSKRDSVPHLTLEKLLVFLLRAGVATNFIRPFYGPSGTDGTARVGFNLKGAVVILSRGPRDRSDRDIWLTHHLRERGVLVIGAKGLYQLGKPPDSDGNTASSINQAKQIGLMLGHCIRSANEEHKSAPLDDRSLILMMTCCTHRQTAAALVVELSLFRDWYESCRGYLGDRIRWSDPHSLIDARKVLVQSHGYEAIHSGHMKYEGYIKQEVAKIIRACSDCLDKYDEGGVLKDTWDATWESITTMQSPAEAATFAAPIHDSAVLITEIGIAITTFEIAVEVAAHLHSPKSTQQRIRYCVDKLKLFADTARGLNEIPSYIHKLCKIVEMDIVSILALDTAKLKTVCLKHMDNCMQRIAFLAERVEPVLEEYGHLQGKHLYKYFVYYDIVDSTATHVAQAHGNAERHESYVEVMKQSLNRTLQAMAIIARKNRGEIFCTNGGIDSDNDGKNIFFSGRMARDYVVECIRHLLNLTSSFPGVYMRVYVLPCDFVRSEVYRHQNSEEVRGPRFWTNCSRVLKAGKAFEETVGDTSSFLLVGDETLYDHISLSFKEWTQTNEAKIETELAEVFRKIPVRYGAFKLRETIVC